ncbi:hypothetical protein DPMN_072858 [Dreissena polymorpha]|uniref:Uncharacterized protein n=1 Tax=Dreissena polymorpha TaxID=45954 RepID=A0A9D4BY10_DREPO|nr:hypothetical protein DPMN_072858 [Dreissena polymorpha]
MRSLKNTYCLSRGSGCNEVMKNRWALSAPVTSEYNSAMQDFTGLTYTTSPQHKDSRPFTAEPLYKTLSI